MEELIILAVDVLPDGSEANPNAWYLFEDEYYFFSNALQEWVNKGGDRPERPPVNP